MNRLHASFARARHRALLAIACCLAIAGGWARGAEESAQARFATGAALVAQLKGVVSVSWSNVPLEQALASLSKTERLAIMLDRRVDPARELRLALPREPLADILGKVAQQVRLGYCQFGPVAYFGPVETARLLRTVAQLRLDETRSLPPAAARSFTQSRGMQWNELAEPRKIIAELAAETHSSLANPEQIPHDLWAARALPPLPWVDRMSLLLAQFGLSFELDANDHTVTLVPFPEQATLVRSYRAPRQAAELAERSARDFPQARVSAAEGRVQVVASLEDHEAIERRLKGTATRPAASGPAKEVYQVAIDGAPLDQVLEQLAERLSLEFQWDREAVERANISRQQLITINVANADSDALLRAVFAGTGLDFQRRGRIVRIFPAAAPGGK